MEKSKKSSEAWRLLDLSFPCRLTTFTTSERKVYQISLKQFTVYKNRGKSLILKTEAYSQTVLPDRSIWIGQNLVEYAKL